MTVERRQHQRHAFSCTVRGGASTHRSQDPLSRILLRGKVVDLSTSGACIEIDRPIEQFTVAPWMFQLPDVPVALPVLAQVRWVQPVVSKPNTYRLGLNFLV